MLSRTFDLICILILLSFQNANGSCVEALAIGKAIARDKLVTSMQGETFEIKIPKVSGDYVVMIGKRQLEIEKRLNLKQRISVEKYRLPQNQDPSVNKRIIRENQIENVVLETPEDILRELLAYHWSINLELTALGSKTESWHGNGHIGEPGRVEKENFKLENFTAILDGELVGVGTWMGDNWELIKSQYIVGKQYEESIYFDTDDDALAHKKIALRKKTWFDAEDPHYQNRESKASMYFVKKSFSGPEEAEHDYNENLHLNVFEKLKLKYQKNRSEIKEDLFTYRSEYQIPVGTNTEAISADQILSSLAKFADPNFANSYRIYPKKKIQNLRYGINLNFKGEKIGFLTVDSYTPISLDINGNEVSRGNLINQIEIEIFPDRYKLYVDHIQEFNDFLGRIEKHFEAKNTTTPKYQQNN